MLEIWLKVKVKSKEECQSYMLKLCDYDIIKNLQRATQLALELFVQEEKHGQL